MEENEAIIRKMYEAFNRQNLDVLDELMAPGYVDHPRQFQGLESYGQNLTMVYRSFLDSLGTIEDSAR